MEILKFLIDFFAKNENLDSLSPLIKLLEENSFDIKKTISNLSLDSIMPLVESFSAQKKGSSFKEEPCVNPIKPIERVCDSEIISALNCYLGE